MPPSLSRLDDAYTAQSRAVLERVQAFTQSRFAAGQYRDRDLERFISAVVPLILAARRQVAALTDAWLAARMTAMLGRPVRPLGVVDTDTLRGVDVAEVYSRPYVTVRTKLAEGLTFAAAVNAGAARLTDLTSTDLQLARTTTAQAVLASNEHVTGYRRVPTGDRSCALCLIASTQRYHKRDLMPIHPNCSCIVLPIVGLDRHVIDRDLLERVHAAVRDTIGGASRDARRFEDYRKLVVVHAHGEIGPVLAVRGQGFTGPGDIAA